MLHIAFLLLNIFSGVLSGLVLLVLVRITIGRRNLQPACSRALSALQAASLLLRYNHQWIDFRSNSSKMPLLPLRYQLVFLPAMVVA